MGRVVRVRGAGAVGVARDELLALLAFVVHRVAQRARDRHQEANERDAENENGAREVRESIYIVQTHSGATKRTNMTGPPPLNSTHSKSQAERSRKFIQASGL